MEQYIGYSVDTLNRMRLDLTKQLEKVILENTSFPNDGHLYKRINWIAQEIRNLTDELAFRHDETITN
jgi:hypothetical protein